MGLTSESDAKEAMKLCMFDLRRGQTEGQELDKILFFYPADLPITNQLSVIGLSEGLITFTRIFSPDAPCEVIEAEKHCHVFYEVEPDIWMVMVVEKENPESIWRVDALRSVLKEIHSLFVMFHGCIRALVDKEPSGGLVRNHLYYFIMDFLSAFENRSPLEYCCWDFSIGKKLQLPNFRDSLKEQGTLQMLTVGREAAIEVQSLVTLLESCVGSRQCYSMTMFQDLLVSTNLSPIDTLNLFTYAVLRLTPIALFRGASAWSSLRKTDTAFNTYAGALQVTSISDIDQYYNSYDPPSLRRHNYPLVRPLQHSKWSKGKDGFLTTDIWGTEVNSLLPKCPTIWLHPTEEKMFLLAYQHRGLTVILLVPVSSVSGDQGISMLKQQIIENASLKMLKVEEKLSRGWGGENAYHVSGYRYLLVDGDRYVSRASPPGKVTTLTKESLVALSKLREEVDLEKARAKWENSGHEKDIEICIRAKNNSWLIARLVRGKELYMVLEKGSETLLFAADATEKFSERYCNGAFSLD
ncbi:vacuolar fusion protein CCZ1 homolog B-like isoform X1 [Salvia splendens]|uniref:vacuolar fusion protein CCZ1 homolog B-like isoform X1 n=1 Tax=Salvia splendens TaxID=180675 RepID=UPI001C255D40|nr:vacuolar fusion protein CCZ1 homolog B-like isoform X1 [Salvia splendens]XP_042031233.1 vacuolar fusion protein CCZ1 homolog B-like isoform X1 [Salvia splendens]XP_042031234.1 vacuolar fusion protein CCZ1 homolog B-like isoform X1 [Salvia splendens]